MEKENELVSSHAEDADFVAEMSAGVDRLNKGILDALAGIVLMPRLFLVRVRAFVRFLLGPKFMLLIKRCALLVLLSFVLVVVLIGPIVVAACLGVPILIFLSLIWFAVATLFGAVYGQKKGYWARIARWYKGRKGRQKCQSET